MVDALRGDGPSGGGGAPGVRAETLLALGGGGTLKEEPGDGPVGAPGGGALV